MDEACASHVAVSDVTRGNSMINLRQLGLSRSWADPAATVLMMRGGGRSQGWCGRRDEEVARASLSRRTMD
jgi:hypothetical protein